MSGLPHPSAYPAGHGAEQTRPLPLLCADLPRRSNARRSQRTGQNARRSVGPRGAARGVTHGTQRSTGARVATGATGDHHTSPGARPCAAANVSTVSIPSAGVSPLGAPPAGASTARAPGACASTARNRTCLSRAAASNRHLAASDVARRNLGAASARRPRALRPRTAARARRVKNSASARVALARRASPTRGRAVAVVWSPSSARSRQGQPDRGAIHSAQRCHDARGQRHCGQRHCG
jgi:hypothetical protein